MCRSGSMRSTSGAGAWLLSDSAGGELPPVARWQIDRWVDDLARLTAGGGRVCGAASGRECPAGVAGPLGPGRVSASREGGLGGEARSAATDDQSRIADLLELTQPAMVAEFWESRRHLGTQHLLVGVPSMGPRAIRPSHFDRIDDQTAHCVSGSNLSPGDYPVGVAIPHPHKEGAMFHLVNLPTPRRRMAYEYYLKTDESRRLAELCHRTLAQDAQGEETSLAAGDGDVRAVRCRRALGVCRQVLQPGQRRTVAPRGVDGLRPLRIRAPTPLRPSTARPCESSRHGMLACRLVTLGNHRAMAGLLAALDAGRFLPPTADPPYRLGWLAALAIAHRDPRPGTDAWLAGLVERKELLVEKSGDAPELAATAAALLLKRHQQEPSLFGLEPCGAEVLTEAGLTGYRFHSAADRQKVRQWWNRQQPT